MNLAPEALTVLVMTAVFSLVTWWWVRFLMRKIEALNKAKTVPDEAEEPFGYRQPHDGEETITVRPDGRMFLHGRELVFKDMRNVQTSGSVNVVGNYTITENGKTRPMTEEEKAHFDKTMDKAMDKVDKATSGLSDMVRDVLAKDKKRKYY
jgi:hypothetical protein